MGGIHTVVCVSKRCEIGCLEVIHLGESTRRTRCASARVINREFTKLSKIEMVFEHATLMKHKTSNYFKRVLTTTVSGAQ